MDKSEILSAIKKKVYYAELPSKIDVSVKDDTLYIIIDADGVLQNMQNDASAFEGWVFCIKSFIPTITHVIETFQSVFIACRMVYRELSLGNSCRKQERDH